MSPAQARLSWAILANSGFHFEFVQGANLLTNSIDSSVVGNDSSYSNVGEDTDAYIHPEGRRAAPAASGAA